LGAATAVAGAPAASLEVVADRVAALEATVARLEGSLASSEGRLADATDRCAATVAAAVGRLEARFEAGLAGAPSTLSTNYPPAEDGPKQAATPATTNGRRALNTDVTDAQFPTTVTSRGVAAHLVTAGHMNVSGDLNINGQLFWHGQSVGFQPPTRAPTLAPSPRPTLEPTTATEHVALVQNGYALVGRAYGPGTAWHPCSSNWASSSTISPDKCGTCTTDMKNSLWSTLASNQVTRCKAHSEASDPWL
jgi:hypothetical protein